MEHSMQYHIHSLGPIFIVIGPSGDMSPCPGPSKGEQRSFVSTEIKKSKSLSRNLGEEQIRSTEGRAK